LHSGLCLRDRYSPFWFDFFSFSAWFRCCLFFHQCSTLDFVSWIDYMWYFPYSHMFMYSSFEFYSFLGWHVCVCLSSSSLYSIHLSIFCNVGIVGLNCYSLFLYWKVFITPLKLRITLIDVIFLIDSYFLSEFEMQCSMLPWILGFELRRLRWLFHVYHCE
jgi:hypothetical protein